MKLNPAKFYLCHVVKELKILSHTLKEEKKLGRENVAKVAKNFLLTC